MSRLRKLIEEQLHQDLEILKELEDARRYEGDPIRRRKYDFDIQQLIDRIEAREAKLEALNKESDSEPQSGVGNEQSWTDEHQRATEPEEITPEVEIPEPVPRQEPTFSFEVVTVNRRGEISERNRGEAQYYREDLGKGIYLEMVKIPGGIFQMGSPEDEEERMDREGPQHEVNVSSFFMGRYAITQAQWRAVVNNVPKIQRELNPDPSRFKGDNRPVEKVSWKDAVEFCARLSQYTKKQYVLPSEAQWEYACRAGTTTPFHFGETLTTEIANYDGNSTYGEGPQGEYREETTAVGHFGVTNAFGLYDMHGNVWEWCADPWHSNYKGAPEDGSVWDWEQNDNRYHSYNDFLVNLLESDRIRVLRGGSWSDNPWGCRSAFRFSNNPDNQYVNIGFRVVRLPPRT